GGTVHADDLRCRAAHGELHRPRMHHDAVPSDAHGSDVHTLSRSSPVRANDLRSGTAHRKLYSSGMRDHALPGDPDCAEVHALSGAGHPVPDGAALCAETGAMRDERLWQRLLHQWLWKQQRLLRGRHLLRIEEEAPRRPSVLQLITDTSGEVGGWGERPRPFFCA